LAGKKSEKKTPTLGKKKKPKISYKNPIKTPRPKTIEIVATVCNAIVISVLVIRASTKK
jgi:hypothetical protein